MPPIPGLRLAVLLFLGAALPAHARDAPAVECVAGGMLIVLGVGSQPSPEGARPWVSVSNPTMRSVRVLHGLGGSAAETRVEQGRTLRLPLGLPIGEPPTPDAILRGMTLLCRPG